MCLSTKCEVAMTSTIDAPSGTRSETRAHDMSPRRTSAAFAGLMAALFVSMLSSTVVMNALPLIVADLHGSQTGYTWVVVATLLSMTATTPVWGKVCDLFSKLRLLQLAVGIYCLGSVIGTFSISMEVLLGARVVQGVGAGGLMALSQVVVAWIAPPRDRGRYAGYIGAVYAVATVSGPLIGGLIADSPLGWRGCFFVSLPIAVAAVVTLQMSLRLPSVKAEVHLDLLGSSLVVLGVTLVLIWLSMAGHQFAWLSLQAAALLGAGLLAGVGAVVVEVRHAIDPVLPLRLFRDRTVLLATLGSAFLGTSMFASSLYPTQYFQLSRGMSPSAAGLMTVSSVGALGLASVVSGRAISTSGRWKPWLLAGAGLVLVGMLLLGTVSSTTPLVLVAGSLFVLGLGLGVTNQNLVVAVQNTVDLQQVGAASALVTFFRSMGGAAGVCVMGALLASRTSALFTRALDGMSTGDRARSIPSGGEVPALATLHEPVRLAYSDAFGGAFGETFLVATPLALASVCCIALMRSGQGASSRGAVRWVERIGHRAIRADRDDLQRSAND